MLYDTLRADMQSAMKNKEEVRLRTLRLVLSACTNVLVEMGKKPTEKLDDGEIVLVVKRLVKQRREAAAQFRAAGQEERAVSEDAERAVLESYLPAGMSEEEVRAVVERVQQKLGVSEKKDRGLLMKTVMGELQGKADGSVVAGAVDAVLV